MDAWQLQCCGEPFQVGEAVEWNCVPIDRPWMADVLGPELAETVTHAEEHHGGEGTSVVTGRVRSIQAVTHDAAPRPDQHPRMHYPVPGTAVLTEVAESDRWFESEQSVFAGYLIDLY